jgi:DNA-binding NtrC family response regulator
MKLGAYDYVTKPVDLEELKILVERARETGACARRSLLPGAGARDFEVASLVGQSAAMRGALEIKRRPRWPRRPRCC